jgi:hypothetical protein
MIKPCLFRKRLVWLTKCLLFCLLGIFIAGRLSDLLNPLIWWVLHRSGTTFLQRPWFIATYYLPLVGTYGFVLGLVPIHRLQELIASFFGAFRSRVHIQPEMTFSRPLLWAWAPVGFVLAYRLFTFPTAREHSVLGPTIYGEGRYEHFFAPLNLRSTSDPSAWIFDRFVLTGPTLFLLAYTFGVWLRHEFPDHPVSPAETP